MQVRAACVAINFNIFYPAGNQIDHLHVVSGSGGACELQLLNTSEVNVHTAQTFVFQQNKIARPVDHRTQCSKAGRFTVKPD
ncbi:hypothetical protein D3C87_1650670 [compost metagenome]